MAQKEIKFIGFLANVDNSIMKINFGSILKIKKNPYDKLANLLLQLTHDTSPFGILKQLTWNLGYYNNEKHRYCVISSLKDNLKFNENNSVTEFPKKLMPFHNRNIEKGLIQKLRLMRLFGNGNVCLPFSYYYVDDEDGVKLIMGGGSDISHGTHVRYTIPRGQKNKLQDFIDNTSLPFGDKNLRLAFDSFEISDQVSNIALSFLALMISLETVFNPAESEISYQIRRNTAALLGKTINDFEKIYGDIKQLYNKRSKLVHTGNRQSITKEDVFMLRQYVRKVILEVYTLGLDNKNLRSKLDKRGFRT